MLAAAADAFMPAGKVTVPFNPTLVNTGSKLVLLDTGNGPSPDGAVGQLFPNLAAAGRASPVTSTSSSSLTCIPDHTNGLRAADGSIAFPNATIVAPEPDWAFWMNDDNMARATDAVTKNYFANTRKVLGGLDEPDRPLPVGAGSGTRGSPPSRRRAIRRATRRSWSRPGTAGYWCSRT